LQKLVLQGQGRIPPLPSGLRSGLHLGSHLVLGFYLVRATPYNLRSWQLLRLPHRTSARGPLLRLTTAPVFSGACALPVVLLFSFVVLVQRPGSPSSFRPYFTKEAALGNIFLPSQHGHTVLSDPLLPFGLFCSGPSSGTCIPHTSTDVPGNPLSLILGSSFPLDTPQTGSNSGL